MISIFVRCVGANKRTSAYVNTTRCLKFFEGFGQWPAAVNELHAFNSREIVGKSISSSASFNSIIMLPDNENLNFCGKRWKFLYFPIRSKRLEKLTLGSVRSLLAKQDSRTTTKTTFNCRWQYVFRPISLTHVLSLHPRDIYSVLMVLFSQFASVVASKNNELQQNKKIKNKKKHCSRCLVLSVSLDTFSKLKIIF